MDAKVEFPQTALAAPGRRTHATRRRSGDRATTLFTLALAFPLAAAFHDRGVALLPPVAGAVAVAVAWTLLFARLRDRDMNWHAVPTALAFALLLPPSVPLWQALLALSFGTVLGEQVFGGRGYSFLHPATAALAFLLFSFPGATAELPGSPLVTAAVLPGAALLLASGLISWRILAGTAAGLAGWLAVKGLGLPPAAVLTPSLALGVVHLVCEPAGAAATNPGRWAYGLLAGMLIVMLGEAGQGVGSTGAVVFAALLASIFAPLIDRVVVLANVNRRRRRSWPTSTR